MCIKIKLQCYILSNFQEFLSLKSFYDEYEIHRYSNFSNLKVAPIESTNKTVENLLNRVLTSHKTKKWYPYLQQVATHLNQKKRKALYGMCPDDAYQPSNVQFIRSRLLQDYKSWKNQFRKRPRRYRLGQIVRKVIDRSKFGPRSYEVQWSDNFYVIRDILHTYPEQYLLRELDTERKLPRAYYREEIQAARPPDTKQDFHFFVEKSRTVHSKRLRSAKAVGGEVQYLLRSKNDPDEAAGRWINSEEYNRLLQNGVIQKLV